MTKTRKTVAGSGAPFARLNLPLSFEPNRGQTDAAVKFVSRGDGYALFLTEDGAVFKLGASGHSAVVRMKLSGAQRARISGEETLPGKVNYFVGNNPANWRSGISTYGKVDYKDIYKGVDLVYYGTQGQLEYDFVVAPGADPKQIALEFSGVKPKLGPDGNLVLTLDGTPLSFRKPAVYQVSTKMGGKKDIVSGSYKVTGNRVEFILGKFDHSRALVIDPVLSYLTYLGGTKTDEIGNTTYSPSGNTTQGIAVDQAGNVYVTGSTQSTDFPLAGSPIQRVNTTLAYTGFVSKLNAAGSQLIYSTYVGGGVLQDNTITRPYAIAVDSAGSAYITGYTTANQFPVTAGAYQTTCGYLAGNLSNCQGTQSAFLTKFSPDGSSLVYSTFLGRDNEAGVGVAVDSHGQAYVAGNSGDQCDSTDPVACFPTTANAVLPGSAFNHTLNPSNFNQGSAFISVFDAAGAHLLYSSLFGGNGSPAGNDHPTFGSGVAVDSSGYFYLVGTTASNQLPVTAGAFQTTYYGNPNPGFGTSSRGFVAKFNPLSSGASLLYNTYLGGFNRTVVSYQDVVSGIAADAAGNAYVSGNASYDFPATAGANNSAVCPYVNGCQNRGFLAKLNPAGSALVWATFVGNVTDPTLSAANTISPPRLDAQGNVYVSGIAGSNTEYPLVNPLQPANGFGGVYVTKYDPTGSTILFSTVIYDPASNSQIFNSGVDVDAHGNIFVAGYTAQTGLPVTAGAFQTALNGNPANNWDGFIAKINPFVSPQTITFNPIASQTTGTQLALSASASSGLPVTFSSNTTGICTLSGNTVSFVTAGACTIQASQSGNSSYQAAAPVLQTFSVFAAQTITFGAVPTQIVGTPLNLSATATSGLPITYTSSTANVCTVSGDTVSFLVPGACMVTASQPGNTTYAAASPVSQSFFVTGMGSLQFIPVTPCRVADTRKPAGPFGGPEIPSGGSRTFAIPQSSCGIPADAAAYSLNVTVVPGGPLGYLTIWPAGQAQPNVSTLNSLDGRIKANAAIVDAGASGAVSVYVSDASHVVLDINGYFAPVTSVTSAFVFYPVTPCRVADTRTTSGPFGGPFISAGGTRSFTIPTSACLIPPSGAYSLNFTVIPHGVFGYLSTWPTGQPQPHVSTLNALTGAVTANAAIVPAGTGAAISVYASNDADLVIDINGYFGVPADGGLSLYTLSPCRVLDTRKMGNKQPFINTLAISVGGSTCGVPATAPAVISNATVVPLGGLGYLSLWPDGQPQPRVSTLNAIDGSITSNQAIIPMSNGSVDAYASDSTNLILDVSGYFAP